MAKFWRKKKNNNNICIAAGEWDSSGMSEGVDWFPWQAEYLQNPHPNIDPRLYDVVRKHKKEMVLQFLNISESEYGELSEDIHTIINHQYIENPNIHYNKVPRDLLRMVKMQNEIVFSHGSVVNAVNPNLPVSIGFEYNGAPYGSVVVRGGGEPEVVLAAENDIPLGTVVSVGSNGDAMVLVGGNSNIVAEVGVPENPTVTAMTTKLSKAGSKTKFSVGLDYGSGDPIISIISDEEIEQKRKLLEKRRIEQQLLKEALKRKNTFIVNEYITLKLEGKKTNIYVDGKKFQQCKFLMLNLEEGKEYKEINSIDDAAKVLSNRMESYPVPEVKPSEEFWGHCSNIQAWVENGYDTRVIHSNLGIPLLKKLIECGDQKALISWKEEIMFRIQETGVKAIIQNRDNIDKYFTEEETDLVKEKLIEIIKSKPNSDIIYIDKLDNTSNYKILLEVYYFLEKINLEKIKKKKEPRFHGDPFAASGGFMEGGMVNEATRTLIRQGHDNEAVIPLGDLDHLALSLNTEEDMDRLAREISETIYERSNQPELNDVPFPTTFDAGMDEDNDVSDHGDFVETVDLAKERFRVLYGEPRSITIYSHPNMKMVAELGNHFNTITARTEYNEVVNMVIIREWVSNTQIPDHNRLYFKNENDQLIQTGELTH